MSQTHVLNLLRLSQGFPSITTAFGAAIAEAGAICLTDEAHEPGVTLEVEGEFSNKKTEQTGASDAEGLPAYIIVVEFSCPVSVVSAKQNPEGALLQ